MFSSGPYGNRATSVDNKTALARYGIFKSIWFWLAILSVCLIFGFYHSSRIFNKTMNPTTAEIYEHAFATPLSAVTDLTGGGGWSNNYEAWIAFKCPGGVLLRQESEFKPDVVEPVRNWFKEKFPESKSLMDKPGNYKCLYRSQSDNFAVRNEWFLYNTRTAEYFYRVTGTQ